MKTRYSRLDALSRFINKEWLFYFYCHALITGGWGERERSGDRSTHFNHNKLIILTRKQIPRSETTDFFGSKSISPRFTTERQIASTARNANASDREIPFTGRYVNFSRYLNNAPLSERNRVEPVLFARCSSESCQGANAIFTTAGTNVDRTTITRTYVYLWCVLNTFSG